MQDLSPQAASSIDTDLVENLQELLLSPKKLSADWQVAAARLTALAHNKTLNTDTNDIEYLKLIALCRWAQKSGIKEAKKKNIQATRFRTTIPPSLEVLGNPELANAALELMISLRGNWCNAYIATQLMGRHFDKKGLNSLLVWATKTTNSVTELLELILTNTADSKTDEKQNLVLIKELGAKLNYLPNLSTETVAEDFFSSVRVITQLLTKGPSKKVGGALTGLLETVVYKVRSSHPSILIRGSFILAIGSIPEELGKTTYKKFSLDLAAQQITPTLSLLVDICTTGGQDGSSYARLVLPSMKSTYLNFDKILNEAARSQTILQTLQNSESTLGELNLEENVTSIYARLLPTWHDFYNSHENPQTLSFLNSYILEAAKLNNVEFLGLVGEVLPFDPILHKVHKDGLPKSNTVRILRPAVIFKRSNNTHRIVLPAIVSPI
jgi:hypothetical protein